MGPMRCAICDRLFDPDESRAMPFCSPRCKQIDRHRWFGEKYGLAYERPDDDSDGGETMLDGD